MRNQYKVLTEKYNLILENPSEWGLEKTDFWYTILKKHMPVTPKLYTDFINWFNKHGEEWAQYNYGMPPGQFCGNDFLEHLFDIMAEDIHNDKNFKKWAERLPDDPKHIKNVVEYKADIMVTNIVYDGFKTWLEQEQERQAALNKDNPGIEMDI